jgi:hypothetical protein
LIVALVAATISTGAFAQPNFATSRGEVMPAAPYAGDVVRHVFTVTNTGAPAGPVLISTTLGRGFLIGTEGDCSPAKSNSIGDLEWRDGFFDSGATRRCTVTMLTRRTAAGTLVNAVTEIRVPPSGYRRVEAAAELGSAPDPNTVRVGPVLVTCAGMIVMGLLALLVVGAVVIVLRARAQVEAPLGEDSASPRTRNLIGAWTAVVSAVGFLVYFGALAYEDWRAYSDYRETRCTVFGSEINAFEHRSRSSDRARDQSYQPVFAVRYRVDGVETFSSGYATPSAFNFNSRAGAGSVFERFAIGTTHPCWYDPQDPQTVVLVRGPGGAYVFALFPLPVLLIGLSMLMGLRRGRREVVTGPG